MKILNLIKTALKAILRNKMRSFLTMLGIIIGVASVITMLAIGEGSKQSIQSQISEMGTNVIMVFPARGQQGGVRLDAASTQSLTLDDVKTVEQESGYIVDVSPLVNGSGQVVAGSNNWPTTLQGVAPCLLSIQMIKVKEGSMFTDYDVKVAAKVCLLGKTVVDNLFPNEVSVVGKTVRFKQIPFKVIGVLAEKGANTFGQDQDDVILVPYTTLQKRVLAITYIHSIYASARSEAVSELAVDEVTEILNRNHQIRAGEDSDFEVRSQQELISMFSSTTKMLTVLLAAIAGISLLVGGIGIMNIMFVSVTERTREIGLRMALGGKEHHILTQFLMEAIIVSVAGGLIGILFGIMASMGVKSLVGWPVSVTQSSIVISFLVCAVIGVFFGWYPARKAAALDPIEALRYE